MSHRKPDARHWRSGLGFSIRAGRFEVEDFSGDISEGTYRLLTRAALM